MPNLPALILAALAYREVSEVTPDMHLADDLQCDGADLLGIRQAIEEVHGDVPERAFYACETVADLMTLAGGYADA